MAYHTIIGRNQIEFFGGRFVYYEQISFANKHIYRIVVSSSFRHKDNNRMNTTSVAGHTGEYKTLYRIRLRFSWSRMRIDIKEWI